MSKVSIYPNAKTPVSDKQVALKSLLNGIKSGKWEDQITAYRKMVDKFGKRSPQDKQAKPTLPAFTTSGVFEKRSLTGLIEHSGYVAIDIDTNVTDNLRKKICIDKYTYACFSSAGGKGLCVVMPIIPEQHNEVFKEIEEYYVREFEIQIDYLADVSRLRFVSFDPDLYLSEQAVTFTLGCETEKEISPNGSAEKIQYWTDEEQIKFAEGIVQRDKQFIEGQRHKYILSLASLCNKLGVPQSVFEAYVNSEYPHFRANPSNAISWTYSNKRAEFGSWRNAKKYPDTYQSLPNGKNGNEISGELQISENKDAAQEITFSFKPEQRKAILSINGVRVCSPGNLFAIIAHAGTGKSQTCEAIGAAHINPDCDSLGFDVALGKGKHFIYIDGERTHDDCRVGFDRIAKRIDLQNNPELTDGERMQHFQMWSFISIETVEERKKKLTEIVESVDIGLLLLDDITTFLADTNDNKESSEIIMWLVALANKHGFGIVCTIHPNPADPDFKPRGHIGTKVWHKAEAVYLLRRAEDDKEVRRLTTDFRYSKTRSDMDINEVNFKWNEEAGMFMSCDYSMAEQAPVKRGVDYENRFTNIYIELGVDELKAGDLYAKYMDSFGASESTAKRHVKEACDIGVLTKNVVGVKATYYQISNKSNPLTDYDNVPF